MLIQVKAIRRGEYAGRVFEPGEILDLPHDRAGLAHTAPPASRSDGPSPHRAWDLGTEARTTRCIAAEHLARAVTTAHPADGLWPVGTGAR